MSNVVVDLASNKGMAISLSLLFPISVGQLSHPECNHFNDLSPPTLDMYLLLEFFCQKIYIVYHVDADVKCC